MQYRYTVHFEKATDGTIIATVPALPGCVSDGQTYVEAEERIQEAIECHLEGLHSEGKEIPIEDEHILKPVTVQLQTA